jgi:hypothetical protein
MGLVIPLFSNQVDKESAQVLGAMPAQARSHPLLACADKHMHAGPCRGVNYEILLL